MSWRRFRLGTMCLVLVGMVVSVAHAQDDNQTPLALAGVAVDATGVLKMQRVVDRGWTMTRKKIAEARSTLPADISKASDLRKISLNRLEAAVKALTSRGEKPTEEMLALAGLTRVKYVFYYPDTKDIVVAGPAQGWMVDPVGRIRGIESGAPVVELQDLIVALRAYPPDGQTTSLISCSIDPTKQGLANMQAFLSRVGSQLSPNAGLQQQGQFIANGLRESLGLQNITIHGVAANTHFAQVLVEADYRMKLIGIGLEKPQVKLVSYVEFAARASSVSPNAMQRWWFVPDYACVRVSDDNLGMELVGDGVKLVGADELVTSDGNRVKSDKGDKAGDNFVKGFTEKYADLATKEPVYAQLRNLIDLSVAAAFIQDQDYYGKSGWKLGSFSDESGLAVQTLNPPKQVESAVASYVKGNRVMTPIGGGVRIEPKQALAGANLLTDEKGEVKAQREKLSLSGLGEGQWWWD